MKTKTSSAPAAVATSTATQAPKKKQSASAFETLLARQAQAEGHPFVYADGIAIGAIASVDDTNAAVRVNVPSLGLSDVPAASMVRLGSQHAGQSVALGFEAGNAHKPIVLGLMMTQQPLHTEANQSMEVGRDGRRVVIEADAELELRCGDAVILLTADGAIQLRGKYVSSHASASNRIRGGSVQIN